MRSVSACALKSFFNWKYFQIVALIRNLFLTNIFGHKFSEQKRLNTVRGIAEYCLVRAHRDWTVGAVVL